MAEMRSCACSCCSAIQWIDVQPMRQYRQILDLSLPWQERSAYATAIDKTENSVNGEFVENARTSSCNNTLPIPTKSLSSRLDQTLEGRTEQEKLQDLGERLFPLIQQLQPELAGKITGMLLEIEHDEIHHLITTPLALKAKVEEAIAVLQAHQAKQLYAAKMMTRVVLYEPLQSSQASPERATLGSYLRSARLKKKSTRRGN